MQEIFDDNFQIKKKERLKSSIQVYRPRLKSSLKKKLKIDNKIQSNKNLHSENPLIFTSISKVK